MTRLNFLFTFTDQGVMQALGKLLNYVKDFSRAAQEQESSLVQLGAALRATGRDAEVSVEEIAGYAAELQRVTKFGDEATIASAKWFAQMPRLDVKNIREYMASSQDLAEVMGTDLKTAAQVLARALEDPRRASRALRRANIMLSTQQRRMLEIFDESGEVWRAQEVIMNAVAQSVGGAAEEMANTMEGVRGQLVGLSEDLKEHLGEMPNTFLFPILKKFKEELEDLSDHLGKMNKETKDGKKRLDEFADSIDSWDVESRAEYIKRAAAETSDWEKASWAFVHVWETAEDIFGKARAAYEGMRDQMDRQFDYPFEEFIRPRDLVGLLGGGAGGAIRDTLTLAESLLKIGEKRAANEKYLARLREEHAEAERERERREAAEDDARNARIAELRKQQLDRQKELRREWESFVKSSEAWIERMTARGRTPAETFVAGVDRLREIQSRIELSREAVVRVEESLVKQYWEQVGAMRELEKAARNIDKTRKDEQRRLEQIRKMDARIRKERAKQREFQSSIVSLTGLWDAMAVGAASTTVEEDQLKELQRQREVLVRQHREAQMERTKAIGHMIKLRRAIEADRAGMSAVFSR